MEQNERDFANEIMEENRELLEGLTLNAGTYAEEGRSDKLEKPFQPALRLSL